ncbi:MAG TPA: YncE family protein [Methylomirabilota bacterium]|jgi:YVTN family beta-propeller protein|nr:YncE family protein [Methylomirabilota bacterium]
MTSSAIVAVIALLLAAAPALAVEVVPGMPPVLDPTNLYSETKADKLLPTLATLPPRVYVPHLKANSVWVIDAATLEVIDKFKVGVNPQHVVPSWDLKTLWVTNNAEGRTDGTLTPIDAATGKPGKNVAVDDPYNMYFTPDGKSAVVVAEAMKRLDFRDPHTLALQGSVHAPKCAGINHGDYSIDGKYLIMTCEYVGRMVKIDWVNRKVLGYLTLPDHGIPQDVRVSPDGKVFYVADLRAGGVHLIDGDAFKRTGFIKTGVGTHGLYPSRDTTKLYVANRGFSRIGGKAKQGQGSVAVIDFATQKVVMTWPIPGAGSPDMGNVSVDGKQLWLSGRYDDVVYVIDTTSGEVKSIPVGREPHGLTVWPQPGRYSLGHTGNMR